ncbi:hypothetical protein [Paludisphaera mucosa]|uniref:Uncharacterized protein n=1 Tax=Paludisphaera mucosa TaxID=3030827 RepID=A0ABT6F8U8_9BACT|nr:hypothetical protein [Paludisphaera mucosa]MDG3004002.1 hypothetical protein [Paludisphaera mucosa]
MPISTGRLYSQSGVDRDGPADWIDLQTLEGRRLGACATIIAVTEIVERFPGQTFRAVTWRAGRPVGRYLVRAMRSRWVQWKDEASAGRPSQTMPLDLTAGD